MLILWYKCTFEKVVVTGDLISGFSFSHLGWFVGHPRLCFPGFFTREIKDRILTAHTQSTVQTLINKQEKVVKSFNASVLP